jgi:hypothetical protein
MLLHHRPVKEKLVVMRRGKRRSIGMEGPANEQDLEKNGNPKIKEEFDKYFDKPTATGRRKTTLPTKDYPFTRRNLNIPGLKYSTVRKMGKKIVKRC